MAVWYPKNPDSCLRRILAFLQTASRPGTADQ